MLSFYVFQELCLRFRIYSASVSVILSIRGYNWDTTENIVVDRVKYILQVNSHYPFRG
jgi:hypothetical protein